MSTADRRDLGILGGISKILLGKHEKRRLLTRKRTRIFEKFQFRHVGGRQKPGVFRGFFDSLSFFRIFKERFVFVFVGVSVDVFFVDLFVFVFFGENFFS